MNRDSKNSKVLLEASGKGYVVDEYGVVMYKGHVVPGNIDKSTGYKRFGVRLKDGSTYQIRVHKLQAYQKFGEKVFEKGLCIRHLNGNQLDNSSKNMDIGSLSDNQMDRNPEERLRMAKRAASFRSKKVLAGGIVFSSYKEAGRYFGISDNGIRKRIVLKWPGYENIL